MTADDEAKRTAWIGSALCIGRAELFFAPPEERDPHRSIRENAAKALCGRCGVRDDCLAYAVANDEPDGVWGGLTTPERRYYVAVERAKAREQNAPTLGSVPAKYKRPQWSTLEERESLHGRTVVLQHARQYGADQFRVIVDGEIVYRTDYEPEAWIALHAETID